jgi:hypothetical protein
MLLGKWDGQLMRVGGITVGRSVLATLTGLQGTQSWTGRLARSEPSSAIHFSEATVRFMPELKKRSAQQIIASKEDW